MTSPAARFAFPAMLAGSAALAFGPWLVRLADVGPVSSAFWRMTLALVPLALLVRLLRQFPAHLPRSLIGATALAGGFFAADLALWHLGIARTTLANATLLGNSASFLLPVYGFVVARAWPGRWTVVALACAAAGTALLVGRSAELSPRHLAGDLLCLGAGGFYAGYFIAINRVRDSVAALPVLLLVTGFGAAALLPAAATVPGGPFWPTDWTPLLLLALGSQVFGQGLIVFAVGHLRPVVVGLTLLVQPLIAGLVGVLRFGEVPGPAEIGGAALVGLALILVRLPGRD